MIHGKTIGPKRISDQAFVLLILIYNALIAAGLFFLSPLLLAIVFGNPKRRRTFRQRMGWRRYPWQWVVGDRKTRRIWVHALSVGEVLAAEPLMTRLIDSKGDAKLFFTTSTLTGFQTAGRLFESSSVHLGYFPYDWLWAVRRVSDMIHPTHVIVTETDIWPTFLWEMKRRAVPVFLVNLRISDDTWTNYKKFKWMAGKMYDAFDRVCVQTQTEMDRLIALGVASDRICMTGNLKFDGISLTAATNSVLAWRNRLNISKNHRMIVAGSTHAGEEAILCHVFNSLLLKNYDVSMVVAPRDPGRSPAIKSLFQENGLRCDCLSFIEKEDSGEWPQVVIVDAIGKLKALYRLAYIAFVGGSMVPSGGHNPLEPAFWGKPVLFGADMRDFGVIAEYLTTGGGAVQVKNAQHLESVLIHLLDTPKAATDMGKIGLNIMKSHQGAVDRTLAFLRMTNAQFDPDERKGERD